MRRTCQTQSDAGRNQGHHHVEGRYPLDDKWLLFALTKEPINLTRMTLANGGVAQHQRVSQYFLQWNLLEGEHWMASRHRNH